MPSFTDHNGEPVCDDCRSPLYRCDCHLRETCPVCGGIVGRYGYCDCDDQDEPDTDGWD